MTGVQTCALPIWEVPLSKEPLRYSPPIVLGWPWHVGPNHAINGATGSLDNGGDRAFPQAVIEGKACDGVCKHAFDILLILFTVADCKGRWKTLRDSFVKSRQKLQLPSGSGAPSQRDWKYAALMSFLLPHMPSRRSVL